MNKEQNTAKHPGKNKIHLYVTFDFLFIYFFAVVKFTKKLEYCKRILTIFLREWSTSRQGSDKQY